jgi:hypothetical protein
MVMHTPVNDGSISGANHVARLNADHETKPGQPDQGTRLSYMAYFAVQHCDQNVSSQKKRPANCPKNLNFSPRLLMQYQAGDPKWEGFALSGGYRLDFQGYTSDGQYANWQIQFGKGQKKGGAAAAVGSARSSPSATSLRPCRAAPDSR